MNKLSIALCIAVGALAGGTAVVSPVMADEPQTTDEITVISSERRPVRSDAPVITSAGKSVTGTPIIQAEIRNQIRFDDLDLATDAGAAELVNRVREAARQGCAELDKIYLPAGPDSICAGSAVRAAMPQIDAAIAEARVGTAAAQ